MPMQQNPMIAGDAVGKEFGRDRSTTTLGLTIERYSSSSQRATERVFPSSVTHMTFSRDESIGISPFDFVQVRGPLELKGAYMINLRCGLVTAIVCEVR